MYFTVWQRNRHWVMKSMLPSPDETEHRQSFLLWHVEKKSIIRVFEGINQNIPDVEL